MWGVRVCVGSREGKGEEPMGGMWRGGLIVSFCRGRTTRQEKQPCQQQAFARNRGGLVAPHERLECGGGVRVGSQNWCNTKHVIATGGWQCMSRFRTLKVEGIDLEDHSGAEVRHYQLWIGQRRAKMNINIATKYCVWERDALQTLAVGACVLLVLELKWIMTNHGLSQPRFCLKMTKYCMKEREREMLSRLLQSVLVFCWFLS